MFDDDTTIVLQPLLSNILIASYISEEEVIFLPVNNLVQQVTNI